MPSFNSITLLGQSGVGKTTLGTKLKDAGWYHYSGDYRIATHFLKADINEWLKKQAMKLPLFAHLLENDAINICSKVGIENLTVLSLFINKVGKQGIALQQFQKHQAQFMAAEKKAMYEVGDFYKKAMQHPKTIGFINDAGGSLIEYHEDKALFDYLGRKTIFVYIDADEALQTELMQRAIDYPKPMCYSPTFLKNMVRKYQETQNEKNPDHFDSNDFLRFIAPDLLAHRRKIALNFIAKYGVCLDAKSVWAIKDAEEFSQLLTNAWQEQRS